MQDDESVEQLAGVMHGMFDRKNRCRERTADDLRHMFAMMSESLSTAPEDREERLRTRLEMEDPPARDNDRE